VSITDACIGWDETEVLLLELAERMARTTVSGPRQARVADAAPPIEPRTT
jgi:hypothetical protein